MEEHTIPVGYLVLPVLLPLAKCVLLQQAVGLDDELRGSSLKANTTLDADDGIAYVAVATYAVSGSNLFYLLYCSHLVVKLLAVDSHNLALLKRNLQLRLVLTCHVLKVSLLGQTMCRVEYLAAADAGSPNAHVVRILKLGEVGKETVLIEVVYLLLTRESLVACKGDNLHTRCHNKEGHIETNLVVAGTCRTMCYGIGTNLLGVACNGNGLEDTLRRYGDRIAVITHHVAVNHILQRLLVILLCNVQCYVLFGAKLIGVLLVGLQLFGRKAAGIGTCSMHLIAILGKFHYCVRGVKTS